MASEFDGTSEVTTESAHTDRFKIFAAVMLALVTIFGALFAWRAAVAAQGADRETTLGLVSTLNTEEARTRTALTSNEHRLAHTSYLRYRELNKLIANGELADATETEKVLLERKLTENEDLAANAKKYFFPGRYIDEDDNYAADREQGELMAAARQQKDLNEDTHYGAADVFDARSLMLVGLLIVLAGAFWVFALAEQLDHPARYALAVGGVALTAVALVSGWIAESATATGPIGDVAALVPTLVAAVLGLTVLGIVFLALQARGTPAFEDNSAEERTKRAVGMLVATGAVLVATIIFFQTDADNHSGDGRRDAQKYAIQSIGQTTSGEAQVNYDYGGAANAYTELDVLATVARANDDVATGQYYDQVRQRIGKLSKLLAPPYYNPESGEDINLAAYQVTTYYTQAVQYSEQAAVAQGVADAWQNKSSTYIVQLTLLAVALTLYGLMLTVVGFGRWLMGGAATVLALVAAVWLVVTYSQPVDSLPDEAIQSYARAVGLSYQGQYTQSLPIFTEALAKAPNYGNALYERGNAAASAGDIAAAIRDLEAAQAAGRNDTSLYWNLGWYYYQAGRYDDSINTTRKALDLNPDLTTPRFVVGNSLLAAGRVEEANKEYDATLARIAEQVAAAHAAKQEPPDTLWDEINESASDLDDLVEWLNGEPPGPGDPPTPPKDAIKDPAAVTKAAQDLSVKLKNYALALEFTGLPPSATPTTAKIGEFEFSDKDGNETDAFPSETESVQLGFHYTGMKDGQMTLRKVYVDGEEYPEYQSLSKWTLGPEGDFEGSFTTLDYSFSNVNYYDDGEYKVEMYVDNQLVQTGTFTIAPDAPEAATP